jgi:hypothetical protein
MRPADMFVLDREGAVKEAPAARPPPYKAPKLTECAPLFQSVSYTPWCCSHSTLMSWGHTIG